MENTEFPSNQGLENEVSQISDGELPPKKPGSKEKGRKRTKTGCLTCRKRRIKCGEERPNCQNCTKSKRQCEGYNQRVVFKDPLNGYRPSLTASFSARHGRTQQPPSTSQNPLFIAPKLVGGPPFQTTDTSVTTKFPPASSPGAERRQYTFQNDTSARDNFPSQPPQSIEIKFDTVDRSYLPEPTNRPHEKQATHYDFNALVKQERSDDVPPTPPRTSPHDWSAGSNTSTAYYHSFPASAEWNHTESASSTSSGSAFSTQFQQGSSSPTNLDTNPNASMDHAGNNVNFSHRHQAVPHLDTQIPHPAAWSVQQSAASSGSQQYLAETDDDPFDVSDEDVQMEEYIGPTQWEDDFVDHHLKNNDLGIVVALQASQDNQGQQIRSFTSFIDRPDMLATYVPSPQSSPLSDSMTARIFCHFINVTAPCISMFERHPANPSLIFQGQPVPPSLQHIWTYTFPTIALQNQAVLHAMLALASLHIAKLQNEPITAALKHYAICLRRIAKCLSSPTRRNEPATLAAAMLLSFFECWTADHQKWSNHLLGSRQLVKEIDFAGMTRYIKSQKLLKRQEERLMYYQAQQQGAGHNFYDDRLRYQAYVDDVDENLVGLLMGKKLRYDQFGEVVDDDGEASPKTFSDKELETYETQRDLFWWYCKQDAYQAILGGGRLFMEYDLWSHCPPRAGVGRRDDTYGTFDHVILLMGRVADFAAKDVKRKRLQMKANGGWRPPESMFKNPFVDPQGQPQFPQKPPSGLRGFPPMPQMPSFSGLIPDVQEAQLPMGFFPSRDNSPESTKSAEEIDLEVQKLEAEEEWLDIRNAFSIIEDHLGDDYQPLGPEYIAPVQTPFGPALRYRTYGIAGIWMNFYMALTACQRAHPSMPPAAMMAAGIAARQTAFFANEIGRIAAGIMPECERVQQVNPNVGGALIESSTCLFVSGVQYQNPAQRAWTINRLHTIARLTGWQSAHAIATGCETSWCKTAELGKGPPYTRMTEERILPDLMNDSRRIDRAFQGKTNEEKRLVVSGTDRVHYALGMLGVEEDFENLDLDNEEGHVGEKLWKNR